MDDRQTVVPLSEDWTQLYKRFQQPEEAPFPAEDKPPKALPKLSMILTSFPHSPICLGRGARVVFFHGLCFCSKL